MSLTISQQDAAAATKRILGLYPEIPASDPKSFAAALASLLSTYPAPVIARAVDPRGGIAVHVEFLNLAKIKKILDGWYDEHYQDVRRQQIANTKRLPAPEVEPQSKERVREGFQKLSMALKSAGDSTVGITPAQEEKSEYDSKSDLKAMT